MRDRFLRGFIAGIVGGIVMNIESFLSFYLNFTKTLYLDFAAIVIYGRWPLNSWEAYFALLTQLLFTGFLGVAFAYLLTRLTSVHYLFKGWFYGVVIWFFVFAAGVAFKIPLFERPGSVTVISNFIGASVFGLALAETLHLLDRRLKT